MAIDFPTSPSVNDAHTANGKTWVWNGVAWKLYGASTKGVSLEISDSAPSQPVPGDMWFESDSGRTFTYYDGAWIELGGGLVVTSPTLSDADNDTLVQVEEGVDDDTIRFDVAGTEKAYINSTGLTVSGDLEVTGTYVGLNVSSDSITDADGDTKIQVEESADEDTIRFDIAGAEKMTLDSSSLTVSDSVSADHFSASGTGANLIPSGTTAERPVSPTAGMIRFNETTGEPEWYSSSLGAWVNFRNAPVIDVAYLVIAGGGGGGGINGGGAAGGGGAGGYRNSYASETSGGGAGTESTFGASLATTYTVVVGAGGSGGLGPPAADPGTNGTQGSNSQFATVTSIGGGYGSSFFALSGVGGDGGSGGGTGGRSNGAGGSGTASQGYDGGNSSNSTTSTQDGGGGGGGAGAAGQDGSPNNGGDGGDGLASAITGSSVTRAGGGGGGRDTAAAGSDGTGGAGGGGNGGDPPTDGTTNTGSGGGGANSDDADGGNGGSGIVILRYPSSVTATVSAGLTSTTTTIGSDKVTVFTAGTGTVSWS